MAAGDTKSLRMGLRSPTGAMPDICGPRMPRSEKYTRAPAFTPEQRGVLLAVNGKVLGPDLFGHPATLRTSPSKAGTQLDTQCPG